MKARAAHPFAAAFPPEMSLRALRGSGRAMNGPRSLHKGRSEPGARRGERERQFRN